MDCIGLSSRKKQSFLYISLVIISLFISTILYYYLGDNKKILNILTFPFHLIGAILIIYILDLLFDSPFHKGDFWYFEKNEYTPFIIKSRSFLAKPFIILALFFGLTSTYVDWKTGVYSYFGNRIFIINNILILPILGYLIPNKIINRCIKDLGEVIDSFKNLFENKDDFIQFKNYVRKKMINKNEIITILVILGFLRIIEIIFPYSMWNPFRKSIFPLVPIWWSLDMESMFMIITIVLGSFIYTYYQFYETLFRMSKNEKIKINLFHNDGFAGLKKIVNHLFLLASSILLLITLYSFLWYTYLDFIITSAYTKNVVFNVVFLDIFTISIFFLPLLGLRNLIKERKIKEKEILLSKIGEVEESLIHVYDDNEKYFNSLEKMHHAFFVLDKIDSFNEWLIGSKKKVELAIRITLTLLPIIIENIINLVKK